jgi:Response regulator receiver domain
MIIRSLIVDDSTRFREAVRRLLERDGIVVASEATTIAEALEEVDQLRPDVVLADIDLAGESGFELVRRLHDEPRGARPLRDVLGRGRTRGGVAGRRHRDPRPGRMVRAGGRRLHRVASGSVGSGTWRWHRDAGDEDVRHGFGGIRGTEAGLRLRRELAHPEVEG